jgi:hypothetical protein
VRGAIEPVRPRFYPVFAAMQIDSSAPFFLYRQRVANRQRRYETKRCKMPLMSL